MKGILVGAVTTVIGGLWFTSNLEVSQGITVISLLVLTIIGGLAGYFIELTYFLIFKANDYIASSETEARLDEVLRL